MISLNPYVYLGGAVAAALLILSFVFMNHQIHHWHTQYDCVNAGECPAGYKGDTLPSLRGFIKQMTDVQDKQTETTQKNVTTVVTVPGPTKTIVKEIHDAPEPANCVTPTLTEEQKNAF